MPTPLLESIRVLGRVGWAVLGVVLCLASPVDAQRIRPQSGLGGVVEALEQTRACRLMQLVGWRDDACAAPDLPEPARTLAHDLDRLIWGEGERPRLDGAWWRRWRALRCQVAVARHVEEQVERAARGRLAPHRRRLRHRARGIGRDLARRCTVDVVAAGGGAQLPAVGRQCAASTGPPGSSVDAPGLSRCLDTLVRTWIARHFPGYAPDGGGRQPNIVVILADDQRADAVGLGHSPDAAGTVPAMPATVDRLVDEGVSFRNAFASSPVCGPSRAALLTAQYAHGNFVFRNEGLGGGAFFGDRNTLALWLHDAGYRTGFFGKYMNQYPLRWASPLRSPVTPAGWDDWRVFDHPGSVPHEGFSMAENGRIVRYGPSDYSTDVLAAQALAFVDQASRSSQPFLLWLSTATPHFPWTPAPRHLGAFDAGPAHTPPSLLEEDVSDKPAWVASLQGDSPLRRLGLETVRRRQLEMQLSVDELVAALLDRLDALGITDETVIVYASDNGQAWGEHRWASKGCPWEECIRVPLVVRYPPLAPLAREEDALVSLVDLPATLADLAGASMPPGRDGRSRVLALDGTERDPPNGVLVEYYGPPLPDWVALREARFKLVEYADGPLELYDLASDPYELESLADRPDQQDRIAGMRARLAALWPGWNP